MKSKAPTQTETDGVQYRRVSNARLALAMTSALSLACFFSAIGYVSYAANLGFGVTMLLVGTILKLKAGMRVYVQGNVYVYKLVTNP